MRPEDFYFYAMRNRMNTVAIYARISKREAQQKQILTKQVDFLRTYATARGWSVYAVYIDEGYSGTTENRPAFQRLLDVIRYRRFDILLVYSIDRLYRDTRQGLEFVQRLSDHAIQLVSATQPIDTTTPMGRLMLGVYLLFAQYERDIISERTKHALAQKRMAGIRLGRPPKKKS